MLDSINAPGVADAICRRVPWVPGCRMDGSKRMGLGSIRPQHVIGHCPALDVGGDGTREDDLAGGVDLLGPCGLATEKCKTQYATVVVADISFGSVLFDRIDVRLPQGQV